MCLNGYKRKGAETQQQNNTRKTECTRQNLQPRTGFRRNTMSDWVWTRRRNSPLESRKKTAQKRIVSSVSPSSIPLILELNDAETETNELSIY